MWKKWKWLSRVSPRRNTWSSRTRARISGVSWLGGIEKEKELELREEDVVAALPEGVIQFRKVAEMAAVLPHAENGQDQCGKCVGQIIVPLLPEACELRDEQFRSPYWK